MSKHLITALAMSTLLSAALPAMAQEKAGKESQTFITKAIEGNMAEIEMGKLAQQQGMSEKVKTYGAMLVKDHSDANAKAMDVAKQIGVTPPSSPTKMQMTDHDHMSKLSGDKFDSEFSTHMVMDHKKDVADYKRQAGMKNMDPTVTYASDTLPTLEKHLEAAQALTSGSKKGM